MPQRNDISWVVSEIFEWVAAFALALLVTLFMIVFVNGGRGQSR